MEKLYRIPRNIEYDMNGKEKIVIFNPLLSYSKVNATSNLKFYILNKLFPYVDFLKNV